MWVGQDGRCVCSFLSCCSATLLCAGLFFCFQGVEPEQEEETCAPTNDVNFSTVLAGGKEACQGALCFADNRIGRIRVTELRLSPDINLSTKHPVQTDNSTFHSKNKNKSLRSLRLVLN